MNVDLLFLETWLGDDIQECPDCKQVNDWSDVYSVCGWHENLVAGVAAVERLTKDAKK